MPATQISKKIEKVLSDSHQNLTQEQRIKILNYAKNHHLNILIAGPTGSGKSSTINALFDTNKALIGLGAEPMTQDINRYEFDNLILWDTPGLGDGITEDERHKKKIVNQLKKKNQRGEFEIDLVLVILDGSSRDMSTSFELINQVIIPNLGESPENRLLIAINQADIAYKGINGWDYKNNQPTEIGSKFLEEKVEDVRRRIKESTGVNTDPIFYSAGYQGLQNANPPYNLTKLLYWIVDKAPQEKRLALRVLSPNQKNWESSDKMMDYKEKTKKSFGFGKVVGAIIGFLFGIF